jgi:hypothetical protein
MTTQKNRPTQGEAVQDVPADEISPAANVPRLADLSVNGPSLNGSGPANKVKEPIDPFDPERLRYDEAEFTADNISTKKNYGAVKVRKPGQQEWFQLHPSLKYQMPAALFVRKNTELLTPQTYLVPKEYWGLFKRQHLTPVRLRLAINSLDTEFLWDIRRPRDGVMTYYHISVKEAADADEATWIRLDWDNGSRTYDYVEALDDLGDPQWQHPERSWGDWLRLAFRGRLIDREDHEVVCELYRERS